MKWKGKMHGKADAVRILMYLLCAFKKQKEDKIYKYYQSIDKVREKSLILYKWRKKIESSNGVKEEIQK